MCLLVVLAAVAGTRAGVAGTNPGRDRDRNERDLRFREPTDPVCPGFHVLPLPDPSPAQLGLRTREAFGLRELVGALGTHAEHLRDLGCSDEMVGHES